MHVEVHSDTSYSLLHCRVLGALVVYCVLGSVLLRVKKKDSFIPNQKFWTALPYLIKVCLCNLALKWYGRDRIGGEGKILT